MAGLSAGPVVAYAYVPPSNEEYTPLLPGRTRRTASQSILYGMLALLIILFVAVNLCLHFFNCPLYPSTMDDIRRRWQEEKMQHGLLQEQWRIEKQDHATIEAEWKLQAERHEWDVARRIREENERQERVRQEWTRESGKHAREVEEYEKNVTRRIQEEGERQERVRREWINEVEKHRQEYEDMERRENQHRENERQKWRQEVKEHHRLEEERKKREEEERQKLNMFWGNVEARTCTTYATREYTAQLMNLPTTWGHRVEACKATPLEVHGISHFPENCEDKGPGVVMGRWAFDQQEPSCTTFWESYHDKGCTSPGSGKKYITHKLMNLPENGDWKEFCATTPISFDHMQFPGAQECFTTVWGVYGQWEIVDSNC